MTQRLCSKGWKFKPQYWGKKISGRGQRAWRPRLPRCLQKSSPVFRGLERTGALLTATGHHCSLTLHHMPGLPSCVDAWSSHIVHTTVKEVRPREGKLSTPVMVKDWFQPRLPFFLVSELHCWEASLPAVWQCPFCYTWNSCGICESSRIGVVQMWLTLSSSEGLLLKICLLAPLESQIHPRPIGVTSRWFQTQKVWEVLA